MSLTADLELSRTLHLQALGTLSGGIPTGLPDQLGELTPVVAAFEEARGKIEADANLTGIGRQVKLADERAKVTATIEEWKTGKITGIDAQVAASESSLRTQAEKAQTVPTEFAVRYMAEKLSALDPLEVEMLYSDATEPERLTIEAAAEQLGRVPRRRGPDGAVVWDHLVNPDRLASARTARLERADPAVAASLADLNRIRNVYSAVASAAVALLGSS